MVEAPIPESLPPGQLQLLGVDLGLQLLQLLREPALVAGLHTEGNKKIGIFKFPIHVLYQ